jgi:Fe-S-cluster-containing hydrogenase component 2
MTCGKTLRRCRRTAPREADMCIRQTATPRICATPSRSTNARSTASHIRRHPCAYVSEGGAIKLGLDPEVLMNKENRSGIVP